MRLVSNPAGAFGYTALDSENYMFGEYVASAAVVDRNVVSFNTSGQVAPSATNGTATLCAGVAIGAIASGNVGVVAQYGIVTGLVAQGAIAAGNPVIRSGTTAGAVAASATPGVGEALGVALAASAGGLVTVFLCKSI